MGNYYTGNEQAGRCEDKGKEGENWFTVFGDIDDFIFYQGQLLEDDDEFRSMR